MKYLKDKLFQKHSNDYNGYSVEKLMEFTVKKKKTKNYK